MPDQEIVAVLYEHTYTYGQLKGSDDEADASSGKSDLFLRAGVAAKFRHIAIVETIRHTQPTCDLGVSDAERETFIAWWRSAAEDIAAALKLSAQAAGSRKSPPEELQDLEGINSSNPAIAAVANEKIETWKVNVCLYHAFGGGRVHEPVGYRTKIVGFAKTGVVSFSIEGGKAFPNYIGSGDPLEAYLAHYDKVRTAGSLRFPDDRYETLFFNYYRNMQLKYFSPEDEARVIETPYWLKPYSAKDAPLPL